MKGFWLGTAVALLLIGGAAGNCFYIHRVAESMTAAAESLPDLPSEEAVMSAERLRAYWEGEVDLVGLSVSCTICDRIGEETAALVSAARAGDANGYAEARALLQEAVKGMKRLEEADVGNLF